MKGGGVCYKLKGEHRRSEFYLLGDRLCCRHGDVGGCYRRGTVCSRPEAAVTCSTGDETAHGPEASLCSPS